jgi:hypothetical protein
MQVKHVTLIDQWREAYKTWQALLTAYEAGDITDSACLQIALERGYLTRHEYRILTT